MDEGGANIGPRLQTKVGKSAGILPESADKVKESPGARTIWASNTVLFRESRRTSSWNDVCNLSLLLRPDA